MDHLINIDNGGTLTDICVWNGSDFTFTKTLTTPYDLSQCLFDGMEKASAALYGETDLVRLLHATDHIRYSTTQGTNALVQRRGPTLGLIVEDARILEEMQAGEAPSALFDDLIGDRVAVADLTLDADALDFELVQQVNRLTTDGAARIVVVGETAASERQVEHILLRRFPRHLLGSVPILYSWRFVADRLRHRRAWSCVVNSFLHPTMEGFLYAAQHRLSEHKISNPLLVYRNDGASSRVSKAVALKTYSSGPRGGLEGTLALARSYGLDHVLMMDVGGTTTDVGTVDAGHIRTDRRGSVSGVPISFPMSNVHSYGVGGSSVIEMTGGEITVGPRSVGAAPGPACFGLGGKEATITDVNLLLGVLDTDTYLDGQFPLDAARARTVIRTTIAEPLGIGVEEALLRMEDAYHAAMARAFAPLVTPGTTLVAFGGAGPMSACGAARRAGVHRVLVPRMAAVFSAFGISFSDIGKSYEVGVDEPTAHAVAAARDDLLARAGRDMFQEGYELAECETAWTLALEDADGELVETHPYRPGEPVDSAVDAAVDTEGLRVVLSLEVHKALPHAQLTADRTATPGQAAASTTRAVRTSPDATTDCPVYVLADQAAGAFADGPAVVEGPFFTARVPAGWHLEVTPNGDLLFTDLY